MSIATFTAGVVMLVRANHKGVLDHSPKPPPPGTDHCEQCGMRSIQPIRYTVSYRLAKTHVYTKRVQIRIQYMEYTAWGLYKREISKVSMHE